MLRKAIRRVALGASSAALLLGAPACIWTVGSNAGVETPTTPGLSPTPTVSPTPSPSPSPSPTPDWTQFLDPTFGSGGVVTVVGSSGGIGAVALQADGKIVAAGGGGSSFFVARFETDGALDVTFGTAGIVFPSPGAFGRANSLAVLPGGAILAGGTLRPSAICTAGSGQECAAIIRLEVDGSLDPLFASGGILETDIAGFGRAIAFDAFGRSVVGGTRCSGFPAQCELVVARFLADGSPDSSFGTAGEVTTARSQVTGIGALDVQADGKIVVAIDDGTANLDVTRYEANGALDLSFNSGGTATLVFSTSRVAVLGMTIQADEKILPYGMAAVFDRPLVMGRLLADGVADPYFGSSGQEIVANPGYFTFGPFLDSHGRILLCGDMADPPDYDYTFALTRYLDDGALDTAFGIDGHIRWNVAAGHDDDCYAMLIQPDGRIVLAGDVETNGHFASALIRLNPQP